MNFQSFAAILIALGILLGAFGGHGLQNIATPEQLETWQTAVFYHLTMAVSLLFLCSKKESYNIPKVLLSLGIIAFSGSLYLYVLTDFRTLVFITPLGGITLVTAWLIAAWQMRNK